MIARSGTPKAHASRELTVATCDAQPQRHSTPLHATPHFLQCGTLAISPNRFKPEAKKVLPSQGQAGQDFSPGSEQDFDVRYAQHRHARTSVITSVAVVIAQAIDIGIVGIVVATVRGEPVVAQYVADAVEAT